MFPFIDIPVVVDSVKLFGVEVLPHARNSTVAILTYSRDGQLRADYVAKRSSHSDTVNTYDPETYERMVDVKEYEGYLPQGKFTCYDNTEQGRFEHNGTLDGVTLVGKYRVFNPDGKLIFAARYAPESGIPDGRYAEYTLTGDPQVKGRFKARGFSVDSIGRWRSYDEQGRLRREWRFHGSSPQRRTTKQYYPNGKLQAKGQYCRAFTRDSVVVYNADTYEEELVIVDVPTWRRCNGWKRYTRAGVRLRED